MRAQYAQVYLIPRWNCVSDVARVQQSLDSLYVFRVLVVYTGLSKCHTMRMCSGAVVPEGDLASGVSF